MLKNSDNRYGRITKSLHWFIGIIILGMLTIGFIMTRMEASDLRWEIYGVHKAIGFLIMWAIFFRVFWRLTNKVPKLPSHLPRWQTQAADLNIKFQYLCLFTMPVTGTTMSLFSGRTIDLFGVYTIPSIFEKNPLGPVPHTIHIWLAYAFAASVLLHISAALYHHFVLKDNVLKRMT